MNDLRLIRRLLDPFILTSEAQEQPPDCPHTSQTRQGPPRRTMQLPQVPQSSPVGLPSSISQRLAR